MLFNYRYKTFPALNKKNNEDSVGIFELPDGLLVVICDAVGGSSNSYKAGQICIKSVNEYFTDSDESDYLIKIRQAIYSANSKIIDYVKNNLLARNLVTTVDILFLQEETSFWGHVGDSRIYKFKNNVLHRMTKDHSVIQKLVDEGFITMQVAKNHPGKGIIFCAVGAGENVNIDVSKMHLNKSDPDKFFVCTDGVTALMTDDEIKNHLKLSDIDSAADKIELLLQSRNPSDDCSFVIVEKKR